MVNLVVLERQYNRTLLTLTFGTHQFIDNSEAGEVVRISSIIVNANISKYLLEQTVIITLYIM